MSATVATTQLLTAAGIAAPANGLPFIMQTPRAIESEGTLTTATFQAIVTSSGASTATFLIQVSNDPLADPLVNSVNAAWVTTATITLTSGGPPNTGSAVVQAPWKYVRAVLSAITGTSALAFCIMGNN